MSRGDSVSSPALNVATISEGANLVVAHSEVVQRLRIVVVDSFRGEVGVPAVEAEAA